MVGVGLKVKKEPKESRGLLDVILRDRKENLGLMEFKENQARLAPQDHPDCKELKESLGLW